MSYDQVDLDFIAETYPDPAWEIREIAEKLDLNKRQVHRIARYKLRLNRPVCRMTDADKQFIGEMYPSPDWAVSQIAKHLCVKEGTVRAYAGYKKLRRPIERGAPYKHNWRKIWDAVCVAKNAHRAALDLGIDYHAVKYAMARMRIMTPDEREAFWQKHGL